MNGPPAIALQLRRNRRVAWIATMIAAGMVGASYASVPLYRLYCQLTGFDGTPVRSKTLPTVVGTQVVTVHFNAEVGRGMPWIFRPEQREITLKVGEPQLAFYRAFNPTSRPITGQATFNVVPEVMAQYFDKVQCFCFNEQTLQPNQSAEMPVQFFIDPAIQDDPDASRIKHVTLSYTFFAVDPPEKGR